MRPTSPRSSPATFTNNSHFDTLQVPSRQTHSRPSNAPRRPNNSREMLKLPGLPRFHPANYPSAHSSLQTTPEVGSASSPQPPPSPRARSRVSDAQLKLFQYHREMYSSNSRTSSNPDKPVSPRLAPLGSPGPVTPLELEGEQGYMVAGVHGSGGGASTTDEIVDKLIQDESRRQQRPSPPRPSGKR